MKMTEDDYIAAIVNQEGSGFLVGKEVVECDCGHRMCVGWRLVRVPIPEGIIRTEAEVKAIRNFREESKLKADPKHKSVLLEAEALINGDRAKDYGDVRVNFTNWRDMCRGTGRPNLKHITAEDLAVIMVCLKVARDSHTPKRDNLVDGAAYFDLLEQVRGL